MNTSIGLQLYLFQQEYFDHNQDQILHSISDMGIQHIEGLPMHYKNYRDACDAHGIEYLAPHIVTQELLDSGKLIAYCELMGAQHIICSGLLEWDNRSYNDYLKSIDLLNSSAQQLKAHGLQLHYHNHEFEFEIVHKQQSGMDILLSNSSSDLDFCLDLGWVYRAQHDPIAFFNKHQDRISYAHLRDFKGTQSTALGQGEINLKPIVETLLQSKRLKHIMIEQDPQINEPLKSAHISIEHLRTLI